MLFRNLSSAELLEFDEVSVIFDCAISYLQTATHGRDISIQDIIDAVKDQCEELLQDALNNVMRTVV